MYHYHPLPTTTMSAAALAHGRKPPNVGVVRPGQTARYVIGVAYRNLLDDDGQRRTLSVQASRAADILKAPEGTYSAKERAQARHAFYHDPSVRLQKAVAEQHSLHGYPIYREHDRAAPPIGEILHSHVESNELRIYAKVTDPAVVAEIDAGHLPDFSIGYDFEFDALGTHATPIKEVSLTRRGFFDGTNVIGVCAHDHSAGDTGALGNKSAQYLQRAGPLASHSAVGTLHTHRILAAARTPPATMSTNASSPQSAAPEGGAADQAQILERLAALEKQNRELAERAKAAESKAQVYQQSYAEQNSDKLNKILDLFRAPAEKEGEEPAPLPETLEAALTNFLTSPQYRDSGKALADFADRVDTLKKEHVEYKTSLETEKTAFQEFRDKMEAERADADETSPELGDMHQPTDPARKRHREWAQNVVDGMKKYGGQQPGAMNLRGDVKPLEVNASRAQPPAKRARTTGPFKTDAQNMFMEQLTQLRHNMPMDIRHEPAYMHNGNYGELRK